MVVEQIIVTFILYILFNKYKTQIRDFIKEFFEVKPGTKKLTDL